MRWGRSMHRSPSTAPRCAPTIFIVYKRHAATVVKP
jgi:hypothetical protein